MAFNAAPYVLMVLNPHDGTSWAYGSFDTPADALAWGIFRMPLPCIEPSVNGQTDSFREYTAKVPLDEDNGVIWDVIRVTSKLAVEIGG